jgi:phenylacetate-CoA ligase
MQSLAISAYGLSVRRKRYGGTYNAILKAALERGDWPRQRILEYQRERLRALVAHCNENVPHYRTNFRERGIEPAEIERAEDLEKLPLLSKETVRENCDALLASDRHRRAQLRAHTSGTTGAGLEFLTDLAAHREQWAVWWRYRMSHGIQPGTWCAYFGGRTIVPPGQRRAPYWRVNFPAKQVLYSTYHMSPEALPRYAEDLVRRKLPWIHGYPSALSLLGRYVLESEIRLRFRWATVGAENLLPWQKRVIEDAFGCRCYQHYGNAEGVANFSECEAGNLHADEDFSIVELVPTSDPERLSIVGTSLSNYVMPLLRYETGDVCGRPLASCPCGRDGLIVARIDGRQEDYVLLNDGSLLGRLDHVFKDAVHIREAQIRQEKAGEIVLRVVPGTGWSEDDELALLREFRMRAGDLLEVKIELCERLERTAAGKLRFVVSSLAEGRLERVARKVEVG